MSYVNKPDDGKLSRAEPLVATAGYTAGGSAIIALIVAFGVDLTTDQQIAIVGVVAVLSPLVVALIARSKVFSPATVDRILAVKSDPVYLDEGAIAGPWSGGDVGREEGLVAVEALATEAYADEDEEEVDKDFDELDALPIKAVV